VPGAGADSTASVDQVADPVPVRRTPLPWAQLLLRVFFLQSLQCPQCSTALVVLAFISDPPVVTKILRHLRLPTEPPPLAPARGAARAVPDPSLGLGTPGRRRTATSGPSTAGPVR
jgi:hypothetical protein